MRIPMHPASDEARQGQANIEHRASVPNVKLATDGQLLSAYNKIKKELKIRRLK